MGTFDYSGPLTEAVILSTVVIRLKKTIEWDAKAMPATNAPEADELIRRIYRKGWPHPVGDDLLGLG